MTEKIVREGNNGEDNAEVVSPEYEAHHNLIGLFSILLEVDRRVNPHLYEKKRK